MQESIINAGFDNRVKDFIFSAFNPVTGYFEEHCISKLCESGKWLILFFYPADFTLVCPRELARLAEKHEALKELGAEAVSLSTDSKYAHLSWRTSEPLLSGVNFLMGTDHGADMARYFGIYDSMNGHSRRATFIISPHQCLVYCEASYFNIGRDADDLLRKMTAIAHFAENNEVMAPVQQEQKPEEEPQAIDDAYREQSGSSLSG